MSDTTFSEQQAVSTQAAVQPIVVADCGECVGSGGWFRYEPALDPAPGLLYLSCVQCRGSGRLSALRG
jgi:hypothetical protein